MVIIGSLFVATHTILSKLIITDPFQQTLLILSLVGFTVPRAALGQKTFSKIRQKVKTTQTVDIKDEPLIENISSRQNASYTTNAKMPINSKTITKKLSPPELGPKDSWHQNNFIKSE